MTPTPDVSTSGNGRRCLWAGFTILWLLGAVAGLSVLWQFENAPGIGATAPARWPADSTLVRTPGQPTLVLLAHPQCSCTLATLDELGEALARAHTRPKTYVLFLKPEGVGNGWEQTDSWRIAAALPGVTAVRDDGGREASRFGAATSGQTLLFAADGTLLFSGGITGARGHAGDNAGRSELVSLLNRGQSARAGTLGTTILGTTNTANRGQSDRDATSVFGCPLFGV